MVDRVMQLRGQLVWQQQLRVHQLRRRLWLLVWQLGCVCCIREAARMRHWLQRGWRHVIRVGRCHHRIV